MTMTPMTPTMTMENPPDYDPPGYNPPGYNPAGHPAVQPAPTQPAAAAKPGDVATLSFEQALKELEGIVGRLERGDVALEESIVIYERGEVLRDHCDRLLRQAEAKVEKLTFDASGNPRGAEPLDPAT